MCQGTRRRTFALPERFARDRGPLHVWCHVSSCSVSIKRPASNHHRAFHFSISIVRSSQAGVYLYIYVWRVLLLLPWFGIWNGAGVGHRPTSHRGQSFHASPVSRNLSINRAPEADCLAPPSRTHRGIAASVPRGCSSSRRHARRRVPACQAWTATLAITRLAARRHRMRVACHTHAG